MFWSPQIVISAITSSVDQRGHSTTEAILNLWRNASRDSAFYLQSTWSEAGTKFAPAFRAGKIPGRRVNGSKVDAIRDFVGNFRPCK
ncbi:hypothetical protein TNCV_5094671 [Trichonephila clavipes]|nr:hypothetical protein TNCV_5094671 [Trichonephila clavipes]